jgi:hypothetical protein
MTLLNGNRGWRDDGMSKPGMLIDRDGGGQWRLWWGWSNGGNGGNGRVGAVDEP